MMNNVNQVFHKCLADLTKVHISTSPGKSLEQESWEYDNIPSVDDISVFLADAQELQMNLQNLQKQYPKFYMKFAIISAEKLVHDLELLIIGLED